MVDDAHWLDEAAAAAASEALAIATDIGQPQRAGDLCGLLAWLAAVAGEEERSLDYVSQAGGQVMGTWAAGLLDLGLGRAAGAGAGSAGGSLGPGRPAPAAFVVRGAGPDRGGRTRRAAGRGEGTPAPVGGLGRRGRPAAVDRPWAAAVVARCRGLLSDGAYPKLGVTSRCELAKLELDG